MAGSDGGIARGKAGLALLAGEGHQQDGIGRSDTDRHDRSHQRGHAEGRAGREQHGDDADQRRREAEQHHQRVAEVLVVHHHKQVDQHRREQEADAEIDEGAIHALDLADDLDRVAGRELLPEVGHHGADVLGDAAEVAALDAGIDLVDRLDVRLVGVGRHVLALERGDVAQQAGHRNATRTGI